MTKKKRNIIKNVKRTGFNKTKKEFTKNGKNIIKKILNFGKNDISNIISNGFTD